MGIAIEDAFEVELLVPERIEEVIDRLRKLPGSKASKQHMLGQWARYVGVRLEPEHFRRVTLGHGPASAD